MSETHIFTVGGTVQASNGLYIPRRADDELLAVCRAGSFAYVLTPRQLGKSSLMVRTAEQLTQEGVRSVIIDLSQIGVQVTPEEWYLGLLSMIEEQLDLDTNAVSWWRARAHLGVTQRLTLFFEAVLLKEVDAPVVVFVDEIDTTLSLTFTDDFFAAIRYFYNARALSRDVRRLSFVLIGVATPGDLIRDPQRTPFNIGQRVDLTDFTIDEALPLAAGLGLANEKARQVLGWVMKWTNGHPYLTQRLCRSLTDDGRKNWTEADVDAMVGKTFFGKISEEDNNLQFVRDMLTKRAPDLSEVLYTYREVLNHKRPVRDEEQSLVKSHLKLSGVAHRRHGELNVRNPIYAEVFNDAWVKQHLPVNWTKRLTRVAIGLVVTLMILSVPTSIWAIAAQRRAAAERDEANRQKQIAVAAQKEAVSQRDEADKLRAVAEEQSQIAQQQKTVANKEREKAEKARQDTEKQRQLAVAAADKEKSARQGESVQRQKAEQAAGAAMQQKALAEAAAVAERLAKENAQKQREIAETEREKAEKLRQLAEEAARREQAARNLAEQSAQEAERQRKIADDLRAKAVDESKTNAQQRDVAQGQHQIAVARRLADQGQQQLISSNAPAAEMFLARALVLDDRPGLRRTLIEARTQIPPTAWEYPFFGLDEQGVSNSSLALNKRNLALVRQDGTIAILDSETGKELRVLRQAETPSTLIFSADGNQLGSLGSAGDLDLWDINTGQFQERLKYTVGNLIAFDSNTKRLIRGTGINEGPPIIESLDLKTGAKIASTTLTADISVPLGPEISDEESKSFFPMALTDDRKLLALVRKDGSIVLHETETGKTIGVIPGNGSLVEVVKFSRDGKVLASMSRSRISLWDVAAGQPLTSFPFDTTNNSSLRLEFSPEGKRLATILGDQIKIFGPTLKEDVRTITPNNLNNVEDVILGPAGDLLAIRDSNGTTRVWDVETGQLVSSFYSEGPLLGFNSDGKELVSVTDRTIRAWKLSGGKSGKLLAGHTGRITNVLFSSDGNFLASTGADNSIRIWDVQAGRAIAKLDVKNPSLLLHDFDPGQNRLGVIERDLSKPSSFQYSRWDLNTKQVTNIPLSHVGDNQSSDLSPDGRLMVTRNESGTAAKIRNIETGREFAINPAGELAHAPHVFAFSHNSLQFAQEHSDGVIKMWDVEAGRESASLQGPKEFSALLFSPDDRMLAVVSRNSIEFWNLGSKQVTSRIPKVNGTVGDSIFSPDGHRFATILGNQRIKVWDVETGSLLNLLTLESVSSVVFSPDGKWLISYGPEPTLWNLELFYPEEGLVLPGHPDGRAIFSKDGWLAYGDQSRVRILDFETVKHVVAADHWSLLKAAKLDLSRRLAGLSFEPIPQIRLREILGRKYSPSYELVSSEKDNGLVETQDEEDRKAEFTEKNTKRQVSIGGTISGTISFSGQPPVLRRIDSSADAVCGVENPMLSTEDWIVTEGKLANVFVYIKGANLGNYSFEPPAAEVVIERKACQTIPHVVGVQAGQLVTFLNSDNTTHNYHPTPKLNVEWNLSVPAGGSFYRTFTRTELLIPLKCNQHPWEKSYIGVLPHPFFAVTKKDGTFTIPDLPPGEYTLVAWHEGGATGIEQSVGVTIGSGDSKTINFTFSKP